VTPKASASTPPTVDSNRIGPSWANPSRPTYAAEWVSSHPKAASVKFCIHVPTFDADSPAHTMAKLRCESAARADPGT